MRAWTVVIAAAVVASIASASAAAPSAGTEYGEAVFVISGKGWGHGVGMSQYGAYGQALEGRTYGQILSYYYPGTTLGRTGRKEVRVLLAEGRRAVAISSTAPMTAVDANGDTYKLAKGAVTVEPDLELPTDLGPVAATGPVVLRAGKNATLALDGRAYRGKLELDTQDDFLRVVNVVPLESYVQGVVAGEMPFGWPLEALKAQAVAARSYALSNLVKGKPFDLYSDVRSQVYLGIAGEKPSTSQAVSQTAGKVVLYGGRVATTYYFSTSGGKTASAADVFGFDVPYLVSRPDPWDKASPYHTWGPLLFGGRTIQSKLDVDARVVDATGVTTPSGRIRSLTLETTSGAETVPASVVRTALGLRSTWITVGVLRLDRPIGGPTVFGSTLQLTGVGRALGPTLLSSSPDGSAWTPVGTVSRDATGTVSRDVKPMRTTRYRLEAAGSASPALLVQVAPRLQLTRPSVAEPDVLTGTIRPRISDAGIVIERRSGSAWVLVGQASVDSTGAFRLEGIAVPGTYRARISATSGYTAATSQPLQVTG